eukprot:179147_1
MASTDEVEPNCAETVEKSDSAVPFFSLFRFSNGYDRSLLVVGALAAMVNGAGLPLFAVIFGAATKALNGPDSSAVLEAVEPLAFWFGVLAAGGFLASFVSLSLFIYVAERQTKRVKEAFLSSVLSQNIGWFDETSRSTIATALSNDISRFEGAIGEKITTAVQQITTFFTGLVIGFVYGWQLALVILACVPLLAVVGAVMAFIVQNISKADKSYAEAGEVAEGALSSITTVTAFSAQEKEISRYELFLSVAEKAGIRKSFLTGTSLGLTLLTLFGAYGLALWYGVELILNGTESSLTGEPYNGGDVLTVFFSIMIGAQSLGLAAPSFPAVQSGRVAAFRLYQIIDRESPIDHSSESGRKLENVRGEIALKNVGFSYPTRSDVPVFKNLNISAGAGKQIAIVGVSGGGKSSVLALIERFYDPDQGSIELDGVDLKELNVKWFRSQIGYVGQEPVLFSGTIRENIKFGRDDISDDQIREAAVSSNAHDFITGLDDSYDTDVGETGHKLSGGQKQRIAIARAIVRNPRILLLDEATSALDTESESVVQAALDRVMVGRTTIIVAHRLSTIRQADKIILIQEGEVTEHGTHDGLMERGGAYWSLVQSQAKSDDVKTQESEIIPQGEPDDSRRVEIVNARTDTVELVIDDTDATGDGRRSSAKLKEKEETKGDEEEDKVPDWEVPNVSVRRLARLSTPYWRWLALGIVGGTLLGCAFPMWALIFGLMTDTLFDGDSDETRRKNATILALVFVGIGLSQVVGGALSGLSFGTVSERLTKRMRLDSFRAMLRQEVGWFDEKDNNTGVLVSRLATDASLVNGAFGGQIPGVVQAIVTTIAGLSIGFYFSWEVSLLMLGLAPLLILSSIGQFKILGGFSKQGGPAEKKATVLATEATNNIRTVASLTAEDFVLARYSAALEVHKSVGQKKAAGAGFFFGISIGILFGIYGLIFWFSAFLISKERATSMDAFTAMFGIMTVAIGLGNTSQIAPDFQKASAAKNNIFYLLDRESAIDPMSGEGEARKFERCAVKFDGVNFWYPTRPKDQVLRDLSFTLMGGETLAIVGESGSGKSTIVSLLLRFYDISSGSITIDGTSIKDIELQTLRGQIGLVQQEPSLFNTSIIENIRYGRSDATDEEVVDAAKSANIHESIEAFPEKYETLCGEKGSKMSGGQKQRIAIARAILRNPRILLLDEATSALDSESERVVQNALDGLMHDGNAQRATIVIAHRLSTVKKCDQIMVMDRGSVVEVGSHAELLTRNGAYANLLSAALKNRRASTLPNERKPSALEVDLDEEQDDV